MNKLLLMLVCLFGITQPIEITLPSEIIYFDVREALAKLGESLRLKSISEHNARVLYTTIYTKAIFQRAEKIKDERVGRRQRLGQHSEPISYDDATREAIKDIESLLVTPEDSIGTNTKIARFMYQDLDLYLATRLLP